MRQLIISITLSIFLVSCDSNQKKDKPDANLTQEEVLDFISRYDALWANRDTLGMREAMDEQYTYFTSTGAVRSRTDILSWFYPADKYKVESAERREISIQLNGNTAIVGSRWIGNGSFGEEKFNDDQRCSLVIRKTGGSLTLIAEHCTQIAGTEE